MKRLAKKHILEIQPYVPGKPIEEVKRELKLNGGVIKLASNESPYGPSPKVLKAIARVAKSINRYPESGCFYLRKELAKRLKVASDQLIFGNGSDEIIVMTLRAFAGKGDDVIVAKPSFLIYDIASRIVGAQVRAVPLKDFYYDLDGMLQAVTSKTKIIFIGNPDNPAGTYITHQQLENFLRRVRSNILIFVDEAYFEYVRARDYPRSINLLKKYKNLIVTRTFSKMYGLAGLRVGYGIARNDVIDVLDRIREPFNVNSLAQSAALACLKDQGYYRRIAGFIEEERRYLYQELETMDISFVKTVTNFVLINLEMNSRNIVKKMLKRGVIVRDMSFWGLDSFIRVTIGTGEENRKFVRVLKAAMK